MRAPFKGWLTLLHGLKILLKFLEELLGLKVILRGLKVKYVLVWVQGLRA